MGLALNKYFLFATPQVESMIFSYFRDREKSFRSCRIVAVTLAIFINSTALRLIVAGFICAELYASLYALAASPY